MNATLNDTLVDLIGAERAAQLAAIWEEVPSRARFIPRALTAGFSYRAVIVFLDSIGAYEVT